MRKINIVIAVLFILSFLAYQAAAQPKAVIDNPVFSFEKVPDGVHVSNDFIIKNMGDTTLNITNVKPP
ncbi:MAG: hypothetical protein PF690_16855 [Deltaproteobacteria bacterium]|jgi:hypothetical protein|nr:hypothetical protein [Deltaproteobacteria bacterium]